MLGPRLTRWEKRSAPLLPPHLFALRLMLNTACVTALLLIALVIGMAGYVHFEKMSLVDSFLNAAMILGGMGQVSTLHTEAGKIFAGSYALFAGITFVIATGFLLAPILHRILHRFHLDQDTKD